MKKIIILLFVLPVLLLAGCAAQNSTLNDNSEALTANNFVETDQFFETEPIEEGTYDSDANEVNYNNSNYPVFPTEVFYLKGLKTLRLSNNSIDSLPAEIGQLTDLEALYLENNNLTGSLPAEIGKMKELKKLDVSGNSMTGIPAEVGQLQKLEILDLSNNQLDTMPNEMYGLVNLRTLDLSGNNYSRELQKRIKKELPNTEILF